MKDKSFSFVVMTLVLVAFLLVILSFGDYGKIEFIGMGVVSDCVGVGALCSTTCNSGYLEFELGSSACGLNKICCRPICDDGTFFGTCSEDKPYYCNSNGELIQDCDRCGCDADGICQEDGSCALALAKKCRGLGGYCIGPEEITIGDPDCPSNDGPVGAPCPFIPDEPTTYEPECQESYKDMGDEKFGCGDLQSCCLPYCEDETISGQCSEDDTPNYCLKDRLIENCHDCDCPEGTLCQSEGNCVELEMENFLVLQKTVFKDCSDGTKHGECSTSLEGKYCRNGVLIDACTKCGCKEEKNCVNNQCVTGIVGGSSSGGTTEKESVYAYIVRVFGLNNFFKLFQTQSIKAERIQPSVEEGPDTVNVKVDDSSTLIISKNKTGLPQTGLNIKV